MAVSSTTQTAALGHQGAAGRIAKYTGGRSRSILAGFASIFEVNKGYASVYQSRYGAAIAASAEAESDAAVTPTTLPSLTGVTISPVGYLASMGVTSEGDHRAIDGNDVVSTIESEITYACERYLSVNSSVGINYQFTQVSASAGTSGSALNRSDILDAANTVWGAISNYGVHLVAIIEGKGKRDLASEALAAGGAAYGNAAMSPDVKALLHDNPFLNPSNYVMTLDGLVHVFVTNDPAELITSSGDKVGCVFVPNADVLSELGINVGDDQRMICEAFGLAYKPDPISAMRKTGAIVKDVDSMVGQISLAYRAYAGSNNVVIDGRGNGATAILNQSAACKLLYVAT